MKLDKHWVIFGCSIRWPRRNNCGVISIGNSHDKCPGMAKAVLGPYKTSEAILSLFFLIFTSGSSYCGVWRLARYSWTFLRQYKIHTRLCSKVSKINPCALGTKKPTCFPVWLAQNAHFRCLYTVIHIQLWHSACCAAVSCLLSRDTDSTAPSKPSRQRRHWAYLVWPCTTLHAKRLFQVKIVTHLAQYEIGWCWRCVQQVAMAYSERLNSPFDETSPVHSLDIEERGQQGSSKSEADSITDFLELRIIWRSITDVEAGYARHSGHLWIRIMSCPRWLLAPFPVIFTRSPVFDDPNVSGHCILKPCNTGTSLNQNSEHGRAAFHRKKVPWEVFFANPWGANSQQTPSQDSSSEKHGISLGSDGQCDRC